MTSQQLDAEGDLFVAEVLVDAAANCWSEGGVTLPATDADEEMLELAAAMGTEMQKLKSAVEHEAILKLASTSAKRSLGALVKSWGEDGTMPTDIPQVRVLPGALQRSCFTISTVAAYRRRRPPAWKTR